jgi:hypothetical protein
MNALLLAGGAVAGVGAFWHGVGGHLSILRRLDVGALAGSFYGGPDVTRRLLVGCWHMFTVVLLVTSAALLWLAAVPTPAGALAARVIGATFGGFTLVYFLCTVDQPRLFVRVPQWIALSSIGALAWLGAGAM